jgi:membrane protein YqaA with SNARE-associated domain
MFDFLLELVGGSAWAYPAIACIVTIDGFFPLVPGETSVVAGAILAANDELSVTLVFVAAAIGAVIGDNVSHLVGDRLGARMERRLFRGERARARLDWAQRQLQTRGSVIIVASRFVPGGRTAVNVLRRRARLPLAPVHHRGPHRRRGLPASRRRSAGMEETPTRSLSGSRSSSPSAQGSCWRSWVSSSCG